MTRLAALPPTHLSLITRLLPIADLTRLVKCCGCSVLSRHASASEGVREVYVAGEAAFHTLLFPGSSLLRHYHALTTLHIDYLEHVPIRLASVDFVKNLPSTVENLSIAHRAALYLFLQPLDTASDSAFLQSIAIYDRYVPVQLKHFLPRLRILHFKELINDWPLHTFHYFLRQLPASVTNLKCASSSSYGSNPAVPPDVVRNLNFLQIVGNAVFSPFSLLLSPPFDATASASEAPSSNTLPPLCKLGLKKISCDASFSLLSQLVDLHSLTLYLVPGQSGSSQPEKTKLSLPPNLVTLRLIDQANFFDASALVGLTQLQSLDLMQVFVPNSTVNSILYLPSTLTELKLQIKCDLLCSLPPSLTSLYFIAWKMQNKDYPRLDTLTRLRRLFTPTAVLFGEGSAEAPRLPSSLTALSIPNTLSVERLRLLPPLQELKATVALTASEAPLFENLEKLDEASLKLRLLEVYYPSSTHLAGCQGLRLNFQSDFVEGLNTAAFKSKLKEIDLSVLDWTPRGINDTSLLQMPLQLTSLSLAHHRGLQLVELQALPQNLRLLHLYALNCPDTEEFPAATARLPTSLAEIRLVEEGNLGEDIYLLISPLPALQTFAIRSSVLVASELIPKLPKSLTRLCLGTRMRRTTFPKEIRTFLPLLRHLECECAGFPLISITSLISQLETLVLAAPIVIHDDLIPNFGNFAILDEFTLQEHITRTLLPPHLRPGNTRRLAVRWTAPLLEKLPTNLEHLHLHSDYFADFVEDLEEEPQEYDQMRFDHLLQLKSLDLQGDERMRAQAEGFAKILRGPFPPLLTALSFSSLSKYFTKELVEHLPSTLERLTLKVQGMQQHAEAACAALPRSRLLHLHLHVEGIFQDLKHLQALPKTLISLKASGHIISACKYEAARAIVFKTLPNLLLLSSIDDTPLDIVFAERM